MVLLMTGCIKLNMDLSVSPDNKVSGTVIFAFDKGLLSLSGQTASQILQSNNEGAPASSAPGTTSAPYEDDHFSGVQYTYDNVDLSQFNQGNTLDSLKIERVGDQFQVSGALDFSNTGQKGSTLGPAAQQALRSAQLSVKLTFPGAVSSSNGTVEGDSVTWIPKIGQKTELTAVASAIGTGGGFPAWIILAGVLVLLLAAAVFVMNRRRRPPELPAEASISPPGEPATAPEAPAL